ncbi:lysophospholipid acyltransferase family protein [Fimbriiglobus ruber]|uniref:Lysophospholipid transporter LplT / 2-acylglycerophosphoethanolamine acyltransferase n=1 Tax=Fimbriiglobus ruber TaxID=1908690 RepID=A0A225DSH5_9BACT|nr:lysophospholipid acyltransferase family protein [Fimbriiglobus ruber]OWK44372.1 Lysophospholipid transporter LplT / 2-acylglycerophosphoethanolamine acyltransferase [Fimbriiglobus ruber]
MSTSIPTRQYPDRTFFFADVLLLCFGLVFGVSFCAFVGGLGTIEEQLPRVPTFFGAWFVGLLLPRLYFNRFRVLAFTPYCATAALVVAAVAELTWWSNVAVALFCLFEGVALGAILRYRDTFRVRYLNFLLAAAVGAGVALTFIVYCTTNRDSETNYPRLLFVASAVLAAAAVASLLRVAVELFVEKLFGISYRVRGHGPGFATLSKTGPVLVIANHASWFDPLFLATLIQRPTTPMMTASFYDKPGLRQLMYYVFNTIRVPEIAARREAPEVREAIAALDAGKCVVIFPEGYLRRSDDQILRRFGQGVWQILKERPDTPVMSCWIEGVWGTFFSHYKGPPTKNKKFDLWLPIRVSASAPEVVPAETLKHHLRTRIYLMNKVLDARTHLGLPAVPRVELPARDDEKDSPIQE